ncbi:NDMA-dependent alcohol dehydrogenase [Pseudomonas sp.]|uniref:NDMA-dependent alcohol dehydrogenase n=1 Tax=Pseudomonas sp. TaxID=306 RepID=UPI0026170500|nr:NDMA-dependent alcohol dehydrogenase [Pseudomonas sp.]
MKTRAAIIQRVPGAYEVVELDLDAPRTGEIMIKMVASGLCLSDEHLTSGDLPAGMLPMCGGHEGAGIVVEVGPHTSGWEVGDHAVLSCLPGCGRCRYCATGHQNLCVLTDNFSMGSRFEDSSSFRLSYQGRPVGQWCGIGTFSEYSTVSTTSAVKIPKDVPLEKACLIGCGVNTGWGATVNSAQVKPGQTVIVMGCGGVGNFAVQGAAHAGALYIIAVDPVSTKRDQAMRVGATHGVATIEEATELAKQLTDGHGADSAAITLGTLKPQHLQQALESVGKNGIVVCTSLGRATDVDFKLSIFDLTLKQKRIQGSMFGAVSPSWDILKMVRMYTGGRLNLDEVISKTYTLDQVNEGYSDLREGKNVRGVIVYS